MLESLSNHKAPRNSTYVGRINDRSAFRTLLLCSSSISNLIVKNWTTDSQIVFAVSAGGSGIFALVQITCSLEKASQR
jgi:hypothetical protein